MKMQADPDKPRTSFEVYSKEFWLIISLSLSLGLGLGYTLGLNANPAPIIIEQGTSQ